MQGADHTLTQALDWRGGTIAGAAGGGQSTTLAAGGTISGGTKYLRDRNLVIAAGQTLQWTSGNYIYYQGSSTITNQGAFAFSNTSSANLYPSSGGTLSFDNSGTLTKTGTSGVYFGSAATFTNTGLVDVQGGELQFASGASYTQTAGTTKLNGGNIRLYGAGPLDIQGGTLSGGGTIYGNVQVGGTMAPGFSPGKITITGNWTLTNTAVTQIEIGGLTQGVDYDWIDVGGTATLAGALELYLWNGWTPGATDVYTIITAGSITGQFEGAADGALITTADGLGQFVIHYNPTSVTLSLFDGSIAVPEPGTLGLLLVFGALAGCLGRFRRHS
ncbi:MAG: hypothetical protein D6776_07435 [Planctomycetota bacterium]|nr:MAG: hypothetical protein D6776_07435 [Planctomycetota bacterium]